MDELSFDLFCVQMRTICIQFVLIFIGKPYLGKPSDMWALGVAESGTIFFSYIYL
jgi:hypothetical protein